MKELIEYIHRLEDENMSLKRRNDNAIAFVQCILREQELNSLKVGKKY